MTKYKKTEIAHLVKEVEKKVIEYRKEPNGRFRSWEHCYTQFYLARQQKNNDSAERLDYLSLHLFSYLASWGMLRGSSFLLQKGYQIHIPAIKEILKAEYNCLLGVSCQDFLDEKVQKAWDKLNKALQTYYGEVRSDVLRSSEKEVKRSDVSPVLLSKILMGVLGCVPAYDRYFKKSVKDFGISDSYNLNSLKKLVTFYKDNEKTFDAFGEKLKAFDAKDEKHKAFDAFGKELKAEDILYPQMKLLDMFFWQSGIDAERAEKAQSDVEY